MSYLNRVILMGNLTSDPQLRYLPDGTQILSFTLAVNIRNPKGERNGEFFPVDVFGGWAENLSKTARKGSLILVEGRVKQDTWIDKQSRENRSRVKVRAFRAYHLQRVFNGFADPISQHAPQSEVEEEDSESPGTAPEERREDGEKKIRVNPEFEPKFEEVQEEIPF